MWKKRHMKESLRKKIVCVSKRNRDRKKERGRERKRKMGGVRERERERARLYMKDKKEEGDKSNIKSYLGTEKSKMKVCL